MQPATPRRSPRIAAAAAAVTPVKIRRSARLAEKAATAAAEKAAAARAKKAENVDVSLESFRKIQAACDAAWSLPDLWDMLEKHNTTSKLELIEEPSRMADAAASIQATVKAIVLAEEEEEKKEKEQRRQAKQDVDEAWESYFIARHYFLLSTMRKQPVEEQQELKLLLDAAERHLSKCIDYADSVCLGYDSDE